MTKIGKTGVGLDFNFKKGAVPLHRRKGNHSSDFLPG
jgi:hypothetical protein